MSDKATKRGNTHSWKHTDGDRGYAQRVQRAKERGEYTPPGTVYETKHSEVEEAPTEAEEMAPEVSEDALSMAREWNETALHDKDEASPLITKEMLSHTVYIDGSPTLSVGQDILARRPNYPRRAIQADWDF